jgi:hypothetical protein
MNEDGKTIDNIRIKDYEGKNVFSSYVTTNANMNDPSWNATKFDEKNITYTNS